MKGKHVNFLHMPGQGLGGLLIRIFIKTEIRSFWVRTPKLFYFTFIEHNGYLV